MRALRMRLLPLGETLVAQDAGALFAAIQKAEFDPYERYHGVPRWNPSAGAHGVSKTKHPAVQVLAVKGRAQPHVHQELF